MFTHLGVGLLVPSLIRSDRSTDLGQGLITMLQGMSCGVAMRDLDMSMRNGQSTPSQAILTQTPEAALEPGSGLTMK